uniref:Cell protein CPr7 n=1 Tax=Odontobuthus doriae TaxID=342590 RepID=A0A0U4GZ20_ODODO|nr:cell protein CPr7 [Odontobuthus doriae]
MQLAGLAGRLKRSQQWVSRRVQKELEGICNPIITKLYQAGGTPRRYARWHRLGGPRCSRSRNGRIWTNNRRS